MRYCVMPVFLDEETEALVTKGLIGRTGIWHLSTWTDLGFEVRWIWDQILVLQITNYDTLSSLTTRASLSTSKKCSQCKGFRGGWII